MKSDITKILNILDVDASFLSKGFSNGYNFDEKKAENYFAELASNSGDNPIFSGIIILQRDNINYTIVDGLQRLTTINLLIAALCTEYKKKNEDTSERIRFKYIIRNSKPKLNLQGKDSIILEKILFEKNLDDKEKKSNIFKVYQKFSNLLEQGKCTPNKLLKIITQIQYLFIITKETEISTRDLYQSLNGMKNDSQINLISDFLAQQGNQINKKWNIIIELFNKKQNIIESFLKNFLQSRFEEGIINSNSIYLNFKKYYEKMEQYQNDKNILETIHKYAIFYLRIINEDFKNTEIKNQIHKLNKNSGEKTYPYLMEVLDDLENGHITEKAFLNILIMMNLFISNNDNDNINSIIDFSKLSKELNKMMIIKDYVPEIISENKLTINEINNLSDFEV